MRLTRGAETRRTALQAEPPPRGWRAAGRGRGTEGRSLVDGTAGRLAGARPPRSEEDVDVGQHLVTEHALLGDRDRVADSELDVAEGVDPQAGREVHGVLREPAKQVRAVELDDRVDRVDAPGVRGGVQL